MSEDNNATEATNHPVGNKDEVPSEAPNKEGAAAGTAAVDPENGGEDGVKTPSAANGAAAGGDSLEDPSTDPNRANAEGPAKDATDRLND